MKRPVDEEEEHIQGGADEKKLLSGGFLEMSAPLPANKKRFPALFAGRQAGLLRTVYETTGGEVAYESPLAAFLTARRGVMQRK